MASTINDFRPLVGSIVQIRVSKQAMKEKKEGNDIKRTRDRIQQKGGSDGSFKVVKVAEGGISTPKMMGHPCVQFESLDGKWWGWLRVEEIEIAP